MKKRRIAPRLPRYKEKERKNNPIFWKGKEMKKTQDQEIEAETEKTKFTTSGRGNCKNYQSSASMLACGLAWKAKMGRIAGSTRRRLKTEREEKEAIPICGELFNITVSSKRLKDQSSIKDARHGHGTPVERIRQGR